MGAEKNNTVISLNEYITILESGRPYEGYVEGLGYAYYEDKFTLAPTDIGSSVLEHRLYHECYLEISQDTIIRNKEFVELRPKKYVVYQKPKKSAKVMTATLATCAFLLADDVTGIGVADDLAIPIILAGGVIIAGICWIFEGNDSYPGPWTPTIPDPTTFNQIYSNPPPPEPPFDNNHFPRKTPLWIVAGTAVLLHEWDKTIGGLFKGRKNKPAEIKKDEN